jgi:hypothetical protein
MAGGLMQLVAYGAQDVYLTGNPKVTFFQAVYKRHTNFAMETIQQTINGSPGNSSRLSVVVARNGDLLGDMFISLQPNAAALKATSNAISVDANWIAERAITSVELSIGGQRIDKHFQTWWRLYSELFRDETERIQYNKMTTAGNLPSSTSSTASDNRVYLPLLFFFNRNPGLYLPLIALQYHEVRLDFELPSNFNSYFSSSSQIFEVWANYVFLDTEERRRFAQKGHEYLIEQVQHTGGDTITAAGSAQTVRLSFNHPVKELVWCYQNATPATYLNSMWNFCTNPANVIVSSNVSVLRAANSLVNPNTIGSPLLAACSNTFLESDLGAFGVASNVACGWVEEGAPSVGLETGPLSQFKLILNGQDRFKEQYGKYFNQYQPSQYHKGNPYPGIYCYSFALQPEEHQPTGTCNFSRIDNAQVQVTLKSSALVNTQKLFAVNYNVLRIQSGMGGLAFSN